MKTAYQAYDENKDELHKEIEKSTQRKKLETNPAKFPAVQTNFL